MGSAVWRRARRVVLVLVLVSVCVTGCRDDKPTGGFPPDAPDVVAVKATMDATCGYKDTPGDVRPSRKNVGNVVHIGPAIYLVRDGKVFAGNDAAKKCSPKLQMTKDLTLQDLEG